MHGDWDDQTATWDSLTEEYKWDYLEFLDSLSLGFKSGIAATESPVSFKVSGSMGSKSELKTDSKGSIFREVKTFDCGSKVVSWVNSVTGFESLSLGAKSGFNYTDYNLFMNSLGVLSMTSYLEAMPNTNVTLGVSFSSGSDMTTSPAGSNYNLGSELKMRTRVSPEGSNSILRDSVLLGSKSGLEDALNIVHFHGEVFLGMQASVWGLGVTTINLSGSLGMQANMFAATGSTFFEDCVFNGVMSDTYVTNYTARDVVFFGSSMQMESTPIVEFSLEEILSMGMSYTARDGWWIRPIESESSGWGADNTISGDWTADAEGSSNGWTPDEF